MLESRDIRKVIRKSLETQSQAAQGAAVCYCIAYSYYLKTSCPGQVYFAIVRDGDSTSGYA